MHQIARKIAPILMALDMETATWPNAIAPLSTREVEWA